LQHYLAVESDRIGLTVGEGEERLRSGRTREESAWVCSRGGEGRGNGGACFIAPVGARSRIQRRLGFPFPAKDLRREISAGGGSVATEPVASLLKFEF